MEECLAERRMGHATATIPQRQRYSPLDQIDRSNVSRLGLAWTSVAGEGGGNQEATPLFWNGVLYAITNWSIVFAVDARTGRELWRYDPKVDRAFSTPGANRGICCGVVNRGIALHDGKVLAPVDRRTDGGARRQIGRAALVHAGSPGRLDRLFDHDGATRGEEQGDCRCRRRRVHAASWVFRGLRRRQRPRAVALLYGARRSVEAIRERSARGGGQNVDGRVVEVRRRRLALGRPLLRSGCESDLRRHRQWRAVAADTARTGRLRQPVCLVHPGRESGQRRTEVALPGRARRFMGHRHRAAAHTR